MWAHAAYTKLFETRIIPRTGDPVWNEQHTVAVAHDVPMLLFLVKDHDRLSAEHVAEVRLCQCERHALKMPVSHPSGHPLGQRLYACQ